jgi:hypothetical protein
MGPTVVAVDLSEKAGEDETAVESAANDRLSAAHAKTHVASTVATYLAMNRGFP